MKILIFPIDFPTKYPETSLIHTIKNNHIVKKLFKLLIIIIEIIKNPIISDPKILSNADLILDNHSKNKNIDKKITNKLNRY